MSNVRQNSELSRFELDIDGHVAFANYRMAGDVMLMPHTETPPALRERGILLACRSFTISGKMSILALPMSLAACR